MLDDDEPPFIKYDEILLPSDKRKEGEGPESAEDEEEMEVSSSEDDEAESPSPPGGSRPGTSSEQARSDALRAETVANILDCLFIPRQVERRGQSFLRRLSREPASRSTLSELSTTFEKYIRERNVRMHGFCPMRRELYDVLFDELLRQATLCCAERGALLLRVRDEFRMTLAVHEKLIEVGVQYGTRKALQAETEKAAQQIQRDHLRAEVLRAEKRILELEGHLEAERRASTQKIETKQARHEQRMEFLRKTNKQLKEQLSYIT